MLFITHDLSLLLSLADRVAIMYAGELVETAAAAELAASPRHPYTQGLLRSFPPLHGPLTRLTGIPGRLRTSPTRRPAAASIRAAPIACATSRRSTCARRRSVRCSARSSLDTGSRATSSRRRIVNATLEIRGLTKRFPLGGGDRHAYVNAADDVSFELRPGTITALVGESGSGKTTVARLIARLHDPTAGTVLFEGADVSGGLRGRGLLRYRSQVQMIFQDPFGSLNPVKTIRHHLARPLQIHRIVPRAQVEERVHELLRTVGLVPPEKSPPSTRTSSPAANASVSRSPARWPSSRRSSSRTNRPACSTSRSGSGS